ncbi:MAG: hypothetical protein EXS05_07760 [Planctomycetaceae bacterium]|nr:hypothetical protein [Planctomycetaceae bacterium]
MQLLFDPIWDWPWVLLAAAGTLASVIGTYRQRLAHLPAGPRRTLLGLRLLAWVILMFALVRPTLEFSHSDPHAAVVLIYADASRSMGIKDAAGGLSRREALLKTLADIEKDLKRLGRDIEVRLIDFDQEATQVETPRTDPVGEQTAIGYVLEQVLRFSEGKPVALLLLLSDGANRALAPRDVDPRAAASRLADQQIRVDTVGFGGTGLTDSSLDLSVEDLEASPTVFVKNPVIVAAKIRALGAQDRELTVRLLVEDPASALPGQPPPMKPATAPIKLKPTRPQEILPFELSFIAQEPGEFKMTLEVLPLEGEPLIANNSLTTYLTVLKGGISIAYFDREHRAEIKHIRRLDESPDIKLDFKPIRLGPPGSKPLVDEDWFAPGKYDVYIIGSVPARAFGRAALEKLEQRVEQGAGLMMTGGTLSFGPGGYAESPLVNCLPVKMQRTEQQNGDTVDPTLHYDQPLQMLPTALGIQHFVMRLDTADKNLTIWKSLPALDGANKFSGLKDGALTLAEATVNDRKVPLLIAQDYVRGRTMAFAGDSTYHWYQFGRRDEHQRFWQQAILWLAHKDQQGDESVWVKLDARRFRVGQSVGMTFGARDAEKRPIDDPEFTIEVIEPSVPGSGERRQSVTPQRAGADHMAKFADTTRPGEYQVRVEAKKDGQAIGLATVARFVVYDQDLELHNPAADFTLLEEIARITGGVTVPPEELGAHLRKLAQQGLNLEVTQIKRVSLWDNWPVLVLFVLSLSGEWYVRKRRGLV